MGSDPRSGKALVYIAEIGYCSAADGINVSDQALEDVP
jgi:hypothetical protein